MQFSSNPCVWSFVPLALAMLDVCPVAGGQSSGPNDLVPLAEKSICILDGQTDQFAGAECPLRLKLRSNPVGQPAESLTENKPISVQWRLMAGDRTLQYGGSRLTNVPGHKSSSEFLFRTPDVRSGVTLSATLFFRLDGEAEEHRYDVRLRTADPFEAIQQIIEDSGFAVIDPHGATAKAFENLSVQPQVFASLRSVTDQRLILIGESIEWDKQLIGSAGELAAAGRSVIVLRPAEGAHWPLGLTGERLAFGGIAGSRWSSNKLDHTFWLAESSTCPGWELKIERNELRLFPTKSGLVWQLAEYQPAATGGCLFVGVPIIAPWNESPVPREFLAHIIKNLLAAESAESDSPP